MKEKQMELIELNSKIKTNDTQKDIQEKKNKLLKQKEDIEKAKQFISQMGEDYKKQINQEKFNAAKSLVKIMKSSTIDEFVTIIFTIEYQFHMLEKLKKDNYYPYRNIKDLERTINPKKMEKACSQNQF